MGKFFTALCFEFRNVRGANFYLLINNYRHLAFSQLRLVTNCLIEKILILFFNNEMDFELKVNRTIVFIRHGQYQKNPEKLTQLRRHQAKALLKLLHPLKPPKIYFSTIP
jgi:hypothetical protein